jgi:hypothetical protein
MMSFFFTRMKRIGYKVLTLPFSSTSVITLKFVCMRGLLFVLEETEFNYPSVLGTSSWLQTRNMFLRWRSSKQKDKIERLSSTRSIHKVTPFQVSSYFHNEFQNRLYSLKNRERKKEKEKLGMKK